ncbi:hypothetical protein CBR_g48455 [Chara braunii]|uniref:Uncharacterized protein n=1 Tax=Chara braunii TaxID=69332 RepID=A0A388M301_CHABU|nr:hypothetical protein CBR_g48455 [Chara braunii]|eukprot:GBG88843.1 hypothetical protein CBR_g48455 [Chara braunii]
MYVLFHGDDLKLNTPPVFEGALRGDDVAALGKKQKCTPFHIVETPFTPTTFQSAGVLYQKGLVYKEMERNPTLLYNLMKFFCPTENAVMFLGKAHAQVVWNLLRSGRHVVAVEGDTKLLNFLNTYVMHVIDTGVHNCELYTGQSAMDHDPNKNFWFNLSSDKRAKRYKFLFLDTRPTYRTKDDYKARRHVAIETLAGYHGGSREAAAKFVEKLEECYFNQGKPEVTLNIFRAHFTEEEDFNPNDDEEVSEGNEEFDLDATYRKHVVAVASSSTPASSQCMHDEVVKHVAEINGREVHDLVVRMYGEQIFEILREHNMLELLREFYDLETSPGLQARIQWVIPSGGGEGGGRGGGGSGGGGGGDHGMGWGGGDQHMGGGGVGGKHGTGAGGHDSTQAGGKSGYPRSSVGTIPPGMGARLHSSVSAVEGASSQSSAGSRLAQPTDEVFFSGGSILPTVVAEVSTMSKSIPVGNIPCTVSAGSNFPCALEPAVVGSVNVVESEQRMDVDVGCLSTGGESIRSVELLPKSQVAHAETVDKGSFRPTTDCAADVSSTSSTAICGEMPVRSHSHRFRLETSLLASQLRCWSCGPSPTLAPGRCAEERKVSVSEQEKGVIHRSLGNDIVRKLFNDYEDLTVVDSSPRKASGGRMALEELSLNEDVEKPRVDSLDPSAEEVLRIVDADIKGLSKFPASLDHIVASGKMKVGGGTNWRSQGRGCC